MSDLAQGETELRSSTSAKGLFSSITASKKCVSPKTSYHQPTNISDLAAHLGKCNFPGALRRKSEVEMETTRGTQQRCFETPSAHSTSELPGNFTTLTWLPQAFRNRTHTFINFHFKQPGENLISALYSTRVASMAKVLTPALPSSRTRLIGTNAAPRTDAAACPCRSTRVTRVCQLLSEPASLPWDLLSSVLPRGEP